MRVVRLCPVGLAVALAVLASAPQASAQERPKIEPTPQVSHSTKATAAFSLPLGLDNWKADIVERNGMYRFRQTNGNCQLTFVQNRGADAARATGRGVRSTLDAYIAGVAARVAKLTRNKAATMELSRVAGKKVTFISEEISYTGNDNVTYHNRISAQWIGDVELLIIAACPSAAWNGSQSLLNDFLSKASIMETPAQK
jgi:hypothetical protein